MSILNEGKRDEVDVSFTVNGMPLQVFKKFKRYSKQWRDNYSVTIQWLMDKYETMEYMIAGQEPQFEEVEYEKDINKDEVQTLGDD